MLQKHCIKANYTITTPVHWSLIIPETISTPLEYAEPAAKWVHRLVIIYINKLYPLQIHTDTHLLLGDERQF